MRWIAAAALLGLGLVLPGAPAAADKWARQEPTSYFSRGFGYVAEIFPPQSRQNPDDKPLCYFYEVGYPGSDWRVDARLKWTAPLVNLTGPHQAVLSPQGDLVTLNEHGHVGYENAVVIYRRDGTLLKAYALDDLLPSKEISLNENEAKVPISISSRWWTRDVKYYFLTEPARFYVVLPWGSALEFLLDSGKVDYAPMTAFAELGALRQRQFVNEETEVWPTSLRFSSITDVLTAKSGGK